MQKLCTEVGRFNEQILIRHRRNEDKGGRHILAEIQRPRVPQNADAVQLRQPDVDDGNVRMVAADFQKGVFTILGNIYIPVSGTEEIFLQKVSLFDIFIGN